MIYIWNYFESLSFKIFFLIVEFFSGVVRNECVGKGFVVDGVFFFLRVSNLGFNICLGEMIRFSF